MKKKIFYVSLIVCILTNIILVKYAYNKQDKDSKIIVYITTSATTTTASLAPYYSKYHVAGCDYLLGTPERVTLSYAKSNGYGACPKCQPTYSKLEEIKENKLLINIIVFLDMIYLYFVMPIYLFVILEKELTQKQTIIISILNSFIIYMIITVLFKNTSISNICLAFISCIINYLILKHNIGEKVYTTNFK